MSKASFGTQAKAIVDTLTARTVFGTGTIDPDSEEDVEESLESIQPFMAPMYRLVLWVDYSHFQGLMKADAFALNFKASPSALNGLLGHYLGMPVVTDKEIDTLSRKWEPLNENEVLALVATPDDYAALRSN